MKVQALLLGAMPLIASVSAQEAQNPLGAIFEKISSFVPLPGVSDTFDAGASKVAERRVTKLKERNWRNVLTSGRKTQSQAAEDWWVLITGGNKTCLGHCGRVETAWNESVALLGATQNPPHLALIDCEATPILCNTWIASAPSIWHFQIPQSPDLPTPIRITYPNATTTTASDIIKLHTSGSWKTQPVHEGIFHPFDGIIHKLGIEMPIAYVLWAFAMLPSWAFMLVVSVLSRSFMGRRAQSPGPPRPGQAAPQGS